MKSDLCNLIGCCKADCEDPFVGSSCGHDSVLCVSVLCNLSGNRLFSEITALCQGPQRKHCRSFCASEFRTNARHARLWDSGRPWMYENPDQVACAIGANQVIANIGCWSASGGDARLSPSPRLRTGNDLSVLHSATWMSWLRLAPPRSSHLSSCGAAHDCQVSMHRRPQHAGHLQRWCYRPWRA